MKYDKHNQKIWQALPVTYRTIWEWGRSWYTLMMRPSKVETAVPWFGMSHAELATFSGHDNSSYIYIYIYI